MRRLSVDQCINDELTAWFMSVTWLFALPIVFVFSFFPEFVVADLKNLCEEFKLDTYLSFDIR